MELGTLVGDPCRIIFRLGPNSEEPTVSMSLYALDDTRRSARLQLSTASI